MGKLTVKSSSRKVAGASKATRPRKKKSLAQLNRWMAANHDALLRQARRNSLALTGKPTFGGVRQPRKSA